MVTEVDRGVSRDRRCWRILVAACGAGWYSDSESQHNGTRKSRVTGVMVLTVILRPSPIFSASAAAFTLPFLRPMSSRMVSNRSMAGIHASETGESMMSVTSGGGNVIESTSDLRGFSIVWKDGP